MGAVAAAIAVVGVVMAHNQQKRAAREQREQNEISLATQKAVDIENRRKLLREERIKRASILAQSFNMGTSGSSSEITGTSNLSTNVASSIANQTGQQMSASAITNSMNIQANHLSKAQDWQAISNLSMQAAGTFDTPSFLKFKR